MSRLQRDLSDSTVMRNLGVALGHALLAYQSLDAGLSKIELDEARLEEDLRDAWEVLAEAIQTVMRAQGIPDAYDRLKAFTRGRPVDEHAVREFIASLDLPPGEKDRLLALEPLIYGEEPFLEAIKRLVLARSYAKVRVLLADPSRAMVDNNRFLALARRLTSCIDLRAMSPEYPASAGAFIIADDKALVYRLQADRWDGISDMNDPAVVRRYLNFFDEVWQTSMQESQMRQMLM